VQWGAQESRTLQFVVPQVKFLIKKKLVSLIINFYYLNLI